MLSCVAEDEMYLSRICFSDEAIYHMCQQAHLLCMGRENLRDVIERSTCDALDENKTLSVPSFLKNLQ
jgi:hypothetical protein